MDDFEEKLNSILASPEAMEQIMALAGSLSGPEGPGRGERPAEPTRTIPKPVAPAPAGLPAVPGDLDPAVLRAVGRLFQEYRRGDDEKTALLRAMAPFLREERRAKVERAARIARLSRVLRTALGALRERGHV